MGLGNNGAVATSTAKPKFDKSDAIARGLCFAYQEGKCTSGDNCTFKHELAQKSAAKERTASPPPKSGPRLPISQVQCMFEKNGACRAGAKCKFMHSENKAAAGTER